MDELELYPRLNPLRSMRDGLAAMRDGLRTVRGNWKKVVAYGLVVLVVVGLAGYRWVTTATPMDRASAVELFRAEIADRDDGTSGDDVGTSGESKSDPARPNRPGKQEGPVRRAGGAAVATAGSEGGATPAQQQQTSAAKRDQGQDYRLPEEGVYSWATEGYEQVNGARRQFPDESQRIITIEGERSWLVHHYFSEEREIWTHFHWGERGAEVERQRNKVTFGPVTNDSTIDFNPPMLVGPRDLEVGYEWGGSWRDETYGEYSSKVIEHTTLDIGGERVEVWGFAYEIVLHGKQEGRVTAKVWLAPDYGLTVKEYYKQDLRSSGAQYQAEWTMQLKSLHPEQ